jgi:hypothetical protein
LFLTIPAVGAEEKPKPAWAVDRSLTVSARGTPAFKYRLLPLSSEYREGNAVPVYLRLVHEQNDAARKAWTETPKPWNALPVDKIPLEEARKFLHDHRYMLRQLELGARRKTADWAYTLQPGDVDGGVVSLLLPDIYAMRVYVPMLILQARVALAEGDYQRAAHHLETGFAFCRHVGEAPTLIHRLVAISRMSQLAGAVADFMERADGPNLYWSLTALPHPMIDVRPAEEWEYGMPQLQFPELADFDRERSPEEWERILRRIRTDLRGLALTPEGGERKLPAWFPKNPPDEPAAKSAELADARAFIAKAKNRSSEQVDAMPPAKVLLMYMVATYEEDRDHYYPAMYLPSPQCFSVLAAAQKQLRDAPDPEAHLFSRAFFPALGKVISAEMRIERSLAALRTVEALRIYAAAHDGKLPEKLSDITEVPVPDDPGSAKPFDYHLEGDTATISSQVPGDPAPSNGVRYRVTIRK